MLKRAQGLTAILFAAVGTIALAPGADATVGAESVLVHPTSINVGATSGQPGVPATITVINRLTGLPAPLGQITITGADAADFGLAADGCSNTSIPPAGRCTASLTYTPSAPRGVVEHATVIVTDPSGAVLGSIPVTLHSR